MRRISRMTPIFALGLLAIGSPGAKSDDAKTIDPIDRAGAAKSGGVPLLLPPSPPCGGGGQKPSESPDTPLNRILTEWQAKTSKIRSVEVRFRTTTTSKLGPTIPGEGHAILAAPNLASLELSSVDADGKLVQINERTIWNGRSILQFNMGNRVVSRYPIRTEWTAPPALLCLPFFFQMTVEQAKRDYTWSLLRIADERIWLLATPTSRRGVRSDTGPTLISLDHKTFTPVKMIVLGSERQDRQTFDLIDLKLNAVEGLDDLTAPCLDAWTLRDMDGWFIRLLMP